MTTLIVSMDDIRRIVKAVGLDSLMDALIRDLHAALQTFDPEQTIIPPRDGFHYNLPITGLIEWMPVMQSGETATIKVVGYHPENPETNGLPTIIGTISSYDTRSGHLIGITDGTFLTALRTGAASAVATSLLAKPDATAVGLIGLGAQAVAQLHALSRVMSVSEVYIHDRDPEAVRSFADRSAVLNLNGLKIAEFPIQTVVRKADVLVTATSVGAGEGPIFEELDTKPWLHVNAAGSDFPGKVELPVGLLRKSLVVPDEREQACEQGECQQLSADQIGPALFEVAQDSDTYELYRTKNTVFDSTGSALEDMVAMDLILKYARDLGLGTEIEIEGISGDAKNPYQFLADVSPHLATNGTRGVNREVVS